MALHNKDLQKLQAMQMIQLKVTGHGNKEIAEAMNISVDTVERRLEFARKAGLFVTWEREILERLIPKALKAIETALEDGDAETAMELSKAMGVIPDLKAPKTQTQIIEDDQLAKAISETRANQALLEGTVDGTVTGITEGGFAGLLTDGNEGDEPTAETATNQNGAEFSSTSGESAQTVASGGSEV